MTSQIINEIVHRMIADVCEQINSEPLNEIMEKFSEISSDEIKAEFRANDIFSDLEFHTEVANNMQVLYADAFVQTSQSLNFTSKNVDCWVQTSQGEEVPITVLKQELFERQRAVRHAEKRLSPSSSPLDQVVPETEAEIPTHYVKQKIRRVGLSKRMKAQPLHCNGFNSK